MVVNTKFLEFLGVLIGDGCILYYPRHRVYGIEIAGNASDQQEYFLGLKSFLEEYTGKRVRLEQKRAKSSGDALRLVLYSKLFAEFLIYDLGFPYKQKTFTVSIPERYIPWKYSKHIIRGLFEADGCLYFSRIRKQRYPTYPRLEIRTVSSKLAIQLLDILNNAGFKANKRSLKSKNGPLYAVYISGKQGLEKWHKEIGFCGLRNLTKYLFWKRFKYYIPNLSSANREQILSRRRQAVRPEAATLVCVGSNPAACFSYSNNHGSLIA